MEPRKTPTVRDVMRRRLVTLTPEMTVAEAAAVLVKNRVSGAPVVDRHGHLLGLLSEFDCLRAVVTAGYQRDGHDEIETVGRHMTADPWTVPPTLDVLQLSMAFVQRHVRKFPVVEGGRLIGLVSRRDALEAAMVQGKSADRPHYPDYPEDRIPLSEVTRH